MKRRDLLRGIGAVIGVGVVGKALDTQAAPELPIVQAPQNTPPYAGLGSITVSGSAHVTYMGSGLYWREVDYNEHQRQMHYMNTQLYGGRDIAPVLGGFDDDGGDA